MAWNSLLTTCSAFGHVHKCQGGGTLQEGDAGASSWQDPSSFMDLDFCCRGSTDPSHHEARGKEVISGAPRLLAVLQVKGGKVISSKGTK